ncbi:MAG: class I SAM-dependent methyltransferase [Caulobacterales bacterium]
MASIYEDGSYYAANPTLDADHGPWKARETLKILRRNGLTPSRICEIGCGSGAVIASLCDLLPAARGEGFDISPHAIEVARRFEGERVRFFQGDALKDPGRYDLALMHDVFEHVEDYLGFLRAARGKADWFAFHIPLEISVLSVLRPHVFDLTRHAVGHLHVFNKTTALSTLRHAGYEVVDYHYTPGALAVGPPTWRKTLANIPRRLVSAVSPGLAQQWLGGFSLMVLARESSAR